MLSYYKNERFQSNFEEFDSYITHKIVDICKKEVGNKGMFTFSVPGGTSPKGVWKNLQKKNVRNILDRKELYLKIIQKIILTSCILRS